MNNEQVWNDVKKLYAGVCSMKDKYINGIDAMKSIWEANKGWMRPFFDDNGRRYIAISEESMEISGRVIKDQIRSFENMYLSLAAKERFSGVVNTNNVKELIEFICLIFADRYSAKEILNNSLSRDYFIPPYAAQNLFQEGTKVTKHFQAFLRSGHLEIPDCFFNIRSEEDKELVIEYIMTIISQVMSCIKRPKGFLVLSINPIDMLLSSAHTSGKWRSCHNIVNGEWRTGPLSYMLDSVSAVAYTYYESGDFVCDEKIVIKDYPKKLWRQMVFFDKDNMSAVMSREYPSAIPSYAYLTRDLAAWVLSEYSGKPHDWVVSYSEDSLDNCLNSRLAWSYIDDPSSIIKLKNIGKRPYLSVGSMEIPCVICGERRSDYDSNSHFCENCEEYLELLLL